MAIDSSLPLAVTRLVKLLSMSLSKKLPLRAIFKDCLIPAVENWRVVECCKEDCSVDRTDLKYSFKQGFPPGMRLKKNFKVKVKEWQRLPYIGPYEELGLEEISRAKSRMMRMEKRAVGIVHEFLSLTVEKMVEVEKISHFRKWFGIDLNVRICSWTIQGCFICQPKERGTQCF
ncbi:UNVERIFIED_CONTAM: protein WHAT'S THIS FACTOR 1, chloroplastic [Sesamum calycinum]|uniref:Protein WHAT'S THIS FACTOR 1, chloroplastic n=1 Tax=Sesamum calycinum TaxID=2727403 RepID=A0AAW2SVP5_9LAMI